MTAADRARTWLFVPGNTPTRFAKAVGSGADAVILDLEDTVRSEDKDAARDDVAAWLGRGGRAWVRVNAPGTPGADTDLERVAALRGLQGVVVPKAEDPATLAAVAAAGVPVVALVESATGIAQAASIAAVPGVVRLAFGSVDFAVDIRAEHTPESLLFARSQLVLASRIAGLPSPIDGVTTALRDDVIVAEEARRSRALGFGAKLCIHPAQLAATAAALAPADHEIEWAQAVMSAAEGFGGAMAGPDGHMIDKPVLDRARAILQA